MDTYESKRGEYVTSHMLADFRKSPAIYKAKYIDKSVDDVDTPAFLFGRAFHCIVLEGPIKFNKEFACDCPINPKTGKPYGGTTNKYTEWAEAVKAEGKTPLTPEMVEQATTMWKQIIKHEKANDLLLGGDNRRTEVAYESEMAGRKIMGRLDLVTDGHIVDLKTCGDLDWFEQDIGRYGYANQMAYYQHLVGNQPDVWLVACEKSFPWRVGTWKLSQTVLDEAHAKNLTDMSRLIQCERDNLWPTGYEEERVFFGV